MSLRFRRFVPIVLAVLLGAARNPALAADCSADMRPGTDCTCKLADLHPTQRAIGRLEVQELEAQGFDKLAQRAAQPDRHPVVVIGPGNMLYLVDGHHHARAMMDLQPTGVTTCSIKDDVRTLPADPGQFWPAMAQRGLARLEGPDGKPFDGTPPPGDLRALPDDPFRSVAGWVEDRCKVKLRGEFADFRLGDALRSSGHVDPPRSEADRNAAVKQALNAVQEPEVQARLAGLQGAEGFRSCR